ncbi:MAG: Holliday junction DNA helicase RuvA [Planctomycetes bacterium]|nr:Holliday junction DNA helicase RuvA [Planctomycetota bacterium]MBI3835535.1 Holliday junction DNA helicase RuvA [Planctomycetota bacterium]
MIVRITGNLIDVAEDSVVVEREGIAREVLVPRFAIGELAAHRGRQITLHTLEFFEGNHASGSLIPRLLGFLHRDDREFFDRFIDVKGIGPRKALKALAEPVRRIASWIESGDAKALARLPGIGNRAAELIVASLKGKMSDLAVGGDGVARSAAIELSSAQRDALEILVAWGDPLADAERWIERAAQTNPELKSPDDWVRTAYRIKTGVAG